MHYNWHRHYDASIGRYTQPDPLGFVDGPSVYGYAKGSPYRYVDRDGRWVAYVSGGATVVGNAGGTFEGGAAYDSGSNSTFGFGSAGYALGMNAGVGLQAGFFTGSKDDFLGWANEFQFSIGPISISFLVVDSVDKCGNKKRHYGASVGPGVGPLPAGFSGGQSFTWEVGRR